MISKEVFIKTIEKIKQVNDIANNVENLLCESKKILYNDFMSLYGVFTAHESTIVDLLEDVFQDKGDGLIVWWMYETDYGKNEKYNFIVDNGEKIMLNSAEKLYGYLLKNMI